MRVKSTPPIFYALRIREHDTLLLARYTTYFEFSNRNKTEGLDLTQRSNKGTPSKGFMLHNTLALTLTGLPLGLLDQRFIDRKQFHGDNVTEKN